MVSSKRRQLLRQQVKPWNDHVAKVRRDNPGLQFKDVLKKAKRTYKKGKSTSGSKSTSGWARFSDSKQEVKVRRKPKRSSSKKKAKRSRRRSKSWLW